MLIPKLTSERVIHAYRLPRTLGTANLSHGRAIGFRITNELASMTPYDVPQKFAKVFDQTPSKRTEHRFCGIRYRTRFDTGSGSHGIALFDDEGERSWPSSVQEIDDDLIAGLKDIGIFVEDPPGVA